ncbi:MAG: response regulator [Planctomycetales bacterium]|nr:response regulator [Planctomycetales bacterium]
MTNSAVLIVDDEEDIREGVSRWLQRAGYDTRTACDGEEGLASIRTQPPDVVLLDVQMPRMGGMQTLAELKQDPHAARIPVVMLSASLRDELQALDAGASYFVHKPYTGAKLISTVNAVLTAR